MAAWMADPMAANQMTKQMANPMKAAKQKQKDGARQAEAAAVAFDPSLLPHRRAARRKAGAAASREAQRTALDFARELGGRLALHDDNVNMAD